MAGTAELALPAPGAPRGMRLRPPALALGLAAAALALHALAFGWAAPLGQAPLAGGALVAAGLGWMFWAAFTFRRERTTLRPAGLPSVLIEEGPYRFGRNPMYLGMTTALLGLALGLGVPLLVAAAVAFVSVLQRVHIPFEEARLRRTFGGWYSDYTAQVRRWI